MRRPHTLPMLLAVLLAWTTQVQAQIVVLPEKVEGLPGAWLVISPKSITGGSPKWDIPSGLAEVDLSALFGDEVAKKAKGKVVVGSIPGKYIISAWNAKGDVPSDISKCEVTIIGVTPPPPPSDTFILEMQKALDEEKAMPVATKVSHTKNLSLLYKNAGPIINDPNNKTAKDIIDTMHLAVNSKLGDRDPPKVLAPLRRTIANELNKYFGMNPDLTPEVRQEFTIQFNRVRVALDDIK